MKKRIFYDVDTQNDFMNKDGALYVTDAEKLKVNLWKLTEHAKFQNIPIIGSRDRHFGTEEYKELEGELQKWGGKFQDHCMDGTYGQKEIQETNLFNENKVYVPNSTLGGSEQLSVELMKIAFWGGFNLEVPVYFEKQSYDVFTNPAFDIFLKSSGIEEAVVYGVATDYCIKAVVLGMQDKGIQCYVVEDAIKGIDPETTKSALEEMLEAGAKFVTTEEVVKGEL